MEKLYTVSAHQHKTFHEPPRWARELLEELVEHRTLRLKRWEARNLRRALFGSKGLNDTPRRRGSRRFTLPSGDTLHFEYEPTVREQEIATYGDALFDYELAEARFVT